MLWWLQYNAKATYWSYPFEQYCVFILSSPSCPPSATSRGCGPIQTKVQHEDAGSWTPCKGDASHATSCTRWETCLQGEVHSPRAEHVGLFCGKGKSSNATYVESANETVTRNLHLIKMWSISLVFSAFSLPSLFPTSQPFLPLSDSNALCDSDESGAEDDEDDDDAFLSDTQITEHSDPNSYR